MSMRTLWGLAEAFGLASHVSSWIRLNFLSKFLGGGSLATQPSGGEQMATPKEGDQTLLDEQRTLLAMVCIWDDQIQTVNKDDAMGTLREIFSKLTNAGRSGAVAKLRQIIAFSSTASITRRPTGEKINGKDVVEETRRAIPEDGAKIILGLHLMRGQSQGTQQDVEFVIQQLDQMGILTNTKDQIADQGKKFSQKAQSALQGTNVTIIEAIVKTRLNTTQYQAIMANPELKKLRATWEAVPDNAPTNKESAATAYADELHRVVMPILTDAKRKRMLVLVGQVILGICITTGVLYFFTGALQGFLEHF